MNMSRSNILAKLPGKTVNDKWRVEASTAPVAEATGGNFSITFRAVNIQSEQPAFIKVVDVLGAIATYGERMGLAEVMEKIATEHKHEVNLASLCQLKKMNRIVVSLDSGDIHDPDFMIPLPYIVFELGESDTHGIRRMHPELDHAWWLRTLHHVSVGLMQLHREGVAHQDVKPSNIVFFGKNTPKIADLGRAVLRSSPSHNDSKNGDPNHLSPEFFYGFRPEQWEGRHLAVDLYMLGSLAYWHFAGVSLTLALLKTFLEPSFAPKFVGGSFQGTFDEALPALESAYSKLLLDFARYLPTTIAASLVEVVRQLCHPNPWQRGHPKDRQFVGGQRYSTERYYNKFLALRRSPWDF